MRPLNASLTFPKLAPCVVTTGSPSFNHAWLIWDWQHDGAPTLAYEPR
jgi:hypothetical protein